jgi:hypothetical protein
LESCITFNKPSADCTFQTWVHFCFWKVISVWWEITGVRDR